MKNKADNIDEMSAKEYKKSKEAEVMSYLREKAEELKASDVVKGNRKVMVGAGREQIFLEHLDNTLERVFKDKLPVPQRIKHKNEGETNRILNLILSDMHFAADIEEREVGHRYGVIEEARRLAEVVKQTAQYKLDYRSKTELNVHLLGDSAEGKIHDPESTPPLAEQCARTIKLLTQAIRYLAIHFKKVTVYTSVGNHMRLVSRHPGRALQSKWDNYEQIINYAVKLACDSLPNVEMKIGYDPKYEFPMFDQVGYGTHGDSHFLVGNPGKSINTANLTRQANAINNARVMAKKKPFSVFQVGHTHQQSLCKLPGNITVITNGALVPSGPFTDAIGIPETCSSQTLYESVPGHCVGDFRVIELNYDTDKDKSLDSIIKPFQGFDK